MTASSHKSLKFLIINPNTSESMTRGLKPIVDAELSLYHGAVECDYFTSPPSSNSGAIPSINSSGDSYLSAFYVLPYIQPLIDNDTYDAYLIACYSEHPLVAMLTSLSAGRKKHVTVTGIFEASIGVSLGIGKFGIVTTGKVWEEYLTRGVNRFLGLEPDVVGGSTKFAGVATTGLTAGQLHELDPGMVSGRITDATREFVERHRDVKALCVGCAGMVGFEDAIRKGVVSVLGEDEGQQVRIVEGVAAGIQWLFSVCRLR